MLRGIDISHWQAGLNLNNINCDFVIIKATGGNGYVDSSCDIFYQQAKAKNIKRGVYHYFSDGFNDGNATEEANWFVDNILGYVGDAMLILDWERGGNNDVTNVGKALEWLQHVEARTTVKPLIYMSLSLINELDWSPVIKAGYGLWCADYIDGYNIIPNYAMDTARDPNPKWDGVVNNALWQFTSAGVIDGYNGHLDCNFFYGNRATWDAYAKASTPPPEPTPIPIPEPTPIPTPLPEPTPVPVEPPITRATFWAEVFKLISNLLSRLFKKSN